MGAVGSRPQLTTSDKLDNTYKKARLSQNLVAQTNKIDPLTRYKAVKKIGVGSMGYVATVKKINDDQDGHLYAMKTLRPGRMTRENVAELKTKFAPSEDSIIPISFDSTRSTTGKIFQFLWIIVPVETAIRECHIQRYRQRRLRNKFWEL